MFYCKFCVDFEECVSMHFLHVAFTPFEGLVFLMTFSICSLPGERTRISFVLHCFKRTFDPTSFKYVFALVCICKDSMDSGLETMLPRIT